MENETVKILSLLHYLNMNTPIGDVYSVSLWTSDYASYELNYSFYESSGQQAKLTYEFEDFETLISEMEKIKSKYIKEKNVNERI